ncbi:hypothetical protein HZS_2140 [Henneguya salminicola]|nr:hypothetical protein HZS_2140 [Henneguya salminicola]
MSFQLELYHHQIYENGTLQYTWDGLQLINDYNNNIPCVFSLPTRKSEDPLAIFFNELIALN